MDKSSDKFIKKFTSQMQARLLLVFCVITILLMGLIGRLVYIMNTDGERYKKQVLSRQAYVSNVLPYKRGAILDRNGTVLAQSELRYRLILEPKKLLLNSEYIPQTLAALKDYFAITEDSVNKILNDRPESQYVILLKNLQLKQVDAFKTLMAEKSEIKGVWFEEEFVRTYPYDTLASDLIGFTSSDNNGYFGIEEYYNSELNGTNGREYGYFDSSLNIERIVKKPVNGNSIVLTVDANAQRIIQKHIKQFNEEFGSKNIGILVMDPNNGDILAMASNQEYNLNSPRNLEGIYPEEELAAMTAEQKLEALNTLWKNDVISMGFEPGSTFKPVTVASALEEAVVSPEQTFFCDGGESVGGWYIKCSNVLGHGEITLGEALMKSCNDVLMQVAASEGRDIFYEYQKSFEFGQKTGIDLPGEENGILTSLKNLNATELATSSFGQTFNTTMIQMAAAYASLVNGGKYYQPHVMKQIVNDSGATVRELDRVLVRQTVSEETSEFIQKYMYQTVEAGTAKYAKVPGYAIGGKTGTAQKYPRDAKTYLVSFLGAVPAINPEIVIYVIVDEPQNVARQDDSSIATKLTSRVMTELLPVLGIYPEGDIDYLLPPKEEQSQTGSETNSNNGSGQSVNTQSNQEGNSASQSNQNQNGNENNENTIIDQTDQNQGGQSNQPDSGQTEGKPDEDESVEDSINPDSESEEDENSTKPVEEEFNGAAIGPMNE